MTIIKKIFSKISCGVTDVFVANALNKSVAMISTIVITRVLSKSEYGIWSYVGNWYSYFSFITGAGMLAGALQFGTESAGKEKEFSIHKYCITSGCLVNFVFSVLFFFYSLFAVFSIDDSANYLRAYIPMIMLEFILQMLLIILRCENRISEYAKLLNINTAFQGIGMCFGAIFGVWGIILGRYLSVILSIIMTCFRTPRVIIDIKSAIRLSPSEIRSLWHFSIFSACASALNCLMTVMDISVISYVIGNPIEVAYYRQAAIIPNSLGIIPSSAIIALLPKFIANYKDKEWTKGFLKRTFGLLTMVNLFVCVTLFIFSPQVIWILSGNGYDSAVLPFRVLIVAYFIGGTVRTLAVNLLSAMRRVDYTLSISVIAAISDIILNFIFVERFGIVGAAYATLLVMIAASVLSMGYMMHVLKKIEPSSER